MYINGRILNIDCEEGLRWINLAAPQNESSAINYLSSINNTSSDTFNNIHPSIIRATREAEGGDLNAQSLLGIMYFLGINTTQNYESALVWLTLAADRGEPLAQIHLADMYALGKGVQRNYIQAHKWYNLAATQLVRSEGGWGRQAIRKREAVARLMSPTEIQEAQALASSWVQKE